MQHEVVGVEDASGLDRLLGERGIATQRFKDQNTVLREVSLGVVDAGYVEMLSAAWQIREHPELGLELVPGQTPDPRWNAVIMLRAQLVPRLRQSDLLLSLSQTITGSTRRL